MWVKRSEVLPLGVEEVSDLLVVDLHVGDLHSEAFLLPLLQQGPLKQGTTQTRDEAGLVHRPHHGERLPRTWGTQW